MIKKWQEWKNDEEKKSECLDDTSNEEIEEDVSDKKWQKWNNDEKKEAECLDDTSPDDM